MTNGAHKKLSLVAARVSDDRDPMTVRLRQAPQGAPEAKMPEFLGTAADHHGAIGRAKSGSAPSDPGASSGEIPPPA